MIYRTKIRTKDTFIETFANQFQQLKYGKNVSNFVHMLRKIMQPKNI